MNKTYGMFLGYKPGAWPPVQNGEKGKPKRAHFTEAPAPEIMVLTNYQVFFTLRLLFRR